MNKDVLVPTQLLTGISPVENNEAKGNINRDTCYRTFSPEKLDALIVRERDKTKDWSTGRMEFRRSPKIEEILEDLFGQTHSYHTGVENPKIADPDFRIMFLGGSLLQGCPYFDEDMLLLILSYLKQEDRSKKYIIEVSRRLASSSFITSRVLTELASWVTNPGPNTPMEYYATGSTLEIVFNHKRFPSERLLEYCNSNIPQVRMHASSAKACPPEGRVLVALRDDK